MKRALDLFSGGGGVALGLFAAGFDEVVGIDIRYCKHYPGTFIQADIHALPVNPMDFDMVWASSPCQLFSIGTIPSKKHLHPNLIPITRRILRGHPYTVIENVPQAPIRKDLVLNGPTVGLPFILRKRHFELSFFMLQPPLQKRETPFTLTITTSLSSNNQNTRKRCRNLGLPIRIPVAVAKTVMGIPYLQKMPGHCIGEAVPPPMAELIGREILRQQSKGE